jgi:dihydrofolate synthase/folylpolyglutamate synthase
MVVATRIAQDCHAEIVRPVATAADAPLTLRARGEFQRRNFALAETAARAYLELAEVQFSEQALDEAAVAVEVPGRLQIVSETPRTVLDGAHNPDAVAALVRALPEVLSDGPLALVLGVLEDKDSAGMLAQLLPLCERAWFTAPPGSRALSPAALQSHARQLGFDAVACVAEPVVALREAQAWALAQGGAVLATGSVYLVGDLLGALGLADASLAELPRRAVK